MGRRSKGSRVVNGRFLFADGTGFESSIGLKRGSPDIEASGCFEQLQSDYAEAPELGLLAAT